MSRAPRNTILVGDAREQLRRLPSSCVDCVMTSPPYYQLRDYGVPGQLGTEPHVDGWVEALAAVLHEVARILKPSGAVWLNLGDSYSTHARYGAPPKGLLLAPERLLLRLARDGWIVRNKVIWAKPNAAPSSVRDRLNATHEPIYFLVRRRRYHFNLDAVRVPYRSPHQTRGPRQPGHVVQAVGALAQPRLGLLAPRDRNPLGKNPGDVWTIPPKPYPGSHPATFPPALVERPLLSTCPRWTCTTCGRPWPTDRSACRCPTGARTPGLVLDPFLGTGTVAVVAEQHGRDWLGIELNPVYAQLARQRLDEATAAVERAA